MLIFFQVYGISQEVKENGTFEISVLHEGNPIHTETHPLNDQESDKSFLLELSLSRFTQGQYQVKVSLKDGETTLLPPKTKAFTITNNPIPDPWIVAQTNPFALY